MDRSERWRVESYQTMEEKEGRRSSGSRLSLAESTRVPVGFIDASDQVFPQQSPVTLLQVCLWLYDFFSLKTPDSLYTGQHLDFYPCLCYLLNCNDCLSIPGTIQMMQEGLMQKSHSYYKSQAGRSEHRQWWGEQHGNIKVYNGQCLLQTVSAVTAQVSQ